MKILVVDDDRELRDLIGFVLRSAGYAIVEAGDGPDAVHQHAAERPDLVILDVNLPGFDGFEVCRRIRIDARTPVMMLTVRGEEADQIRGLDLGADDYLAKPFSPNALIARVRALLRRAGADSFAPLAAGAIVLDPDLQTVSVAAAAKVRLTNLEFRLLQFLVSTPHDCAGAPVAPGLGTPIDERSPTLEAAGASRAAEDRARSRRSPLPQDGVRRRLPVGGLRRRGHSPSSYQSGIRGAL